MQIDILGGMGMETKEKAVQAQTGAAKGKKSRKKVWAVVIGVLLAVIVVADHPPDVPACPAAHRHPPAPPATRGKRLGRALVRGFSLLSQRVC